jgi:hypothetical protein
MKVVALGSIGHDGQEFVKDDVLEVNPTEGDALIEAGVARPFDPDSNEDEADYKGGNSQPEIEVVTSDQLMKKTRTQINNFAGDQGLDVSQLDTKREAVEAILDHLEDEAEEE